MTNTALRVRAALLLAVLCTVTDAGSARAQTAPPLPPVELQLLRIESTPAGALPRMALPMPAHRDRHYLAFRLQTGYRGGRGGGTDMPAIAGGIDLQWRGGSIIGVTAGYQGRDCELLGPDCGGHAMFEGRARFNFLTGGSTAARLVRDYSATITGGAELGFGYAPAVVPGSPACTFDVGLPVSLAMMQTVRFVAFATPGVIWDVDCGGEPTPGRASYKSSLGVGVQQLGLRGLDAYVGVQKLFRAGSGYQMGVSVTYTLLP